MCTNLAHPITIKVTTQRLSHIFKCNIRSFIHLFSTQNWSERVSTTLRCTLYSFFAGNCCETKQNNSVFGHLLISSTISVSYSSTIRNFFQKCVHRFFTHSLSFPCAQRKLKIISQLFVQMIQEFGKKPNAASELQKQCFATIFLKLRDLMIIILREVCIKAEKRKNWTFIIYKLLPPSKLCRISMEGEINWVLKPVPTFTTNCL